MKKLLYPLFLAGICMILGAGCDSENANEPDQPVSPVDPVNPIDSIAKDTISSDTATEEITGIGYYSVIIPNDIELPPFKAYEGPIEPLSETIRPYIVEGKKWLNMQVRTYDQSTNVVYNTFFKGEREEGAVTGKIRYMEDKENGLYFEDSNGTVNKLFGEKNGKFLPVFQINPQESSSYQSRHDRIYLTIISQGTITLMGRELRAVKLWGGVHSTFIPYEYWVEGIGPLFGSVADYYHAFCTCIPPLYYDIILQCTDENGKVIYDYREFKPELYKELEVFTDIDKQ